MIGTCYRPPKAWRMMVARMEKVARRSLVVDERELARAREEVRRLEERAKRAAREDRYGTVGVDTIEG